MGSVKYSSSCGINDENEPMLYFFGLISNAAVTLSVEGAGF